MLSLTCNCVMYCPLEALFCCCFQNSGVLQAEEEFVENLDMKMILKKKMEK